MSESPSRSARTADFTFRAGEFTQDELRVTRFDGREGISTLFEFRVELCSDLATVDAASLVGQPCVLEIAGAHGSRFVNGIVRRFSRLGEGVNLTFYAAEIVPVHWLLTRRHRSRIFQELSIPDIIRKVFEDAGIPTDNYRFALEGQYTAREYVVQYRESEFDFITRLMEREGIFYFFEHAVDGHKMVIADSGVAHVATPEQAEYPYRAPLGLVPEERHEHIYKAEDHQEIRTGAVALDDFDFQKPPTQLRADVATDQFSALRFEEYPGQYTERSEGQRYARLRLEEFQCARRRLNMAGTTRLLMPGYKFTLSEHPSEAMNDEFLVCHLRHAAVMPQSAEEEAAEPRESEYRLDIEAILATVPFRPPRQTPQPTVRGSQTALVVGPSGEEIYTDEYGRVKVQFHWDQEGVYDDKSSCWIRVVQGLAGGNYGMMFLPRVGQEVVVDFLEGDPDQPVITGRVYNKDHMPPYPLPDEKTKSCIKTNSSKGGGGTNELRFEDKKGSEQILIHAQKDFHVRVRGNRVVTVLGDDHLSVQKNSIEFVKESRHTEVKLDTATKVGGNVTLEVAGDGGYDYAGNLSIAGGGNVYLKAGSNLVIEAGTALTLKAGGSFIKIDGSGVAVQGNSVKLNSGGAPGSGSAVNTQTPDEAALADDVKPGQDVTYTTQPGEYERIEVTRIGGTGEEESEQQEDSWIEIELVDDDGNPVPNERYEVTLPNGNIRHGNLDENGFARINGIRPGECEINFPRLDREGWRR
jgi:type VI secretion system secreted protein VgrG